MHEFKNKPNLTLHGRTWDAQHLDKFLDSQWGQRMLVNSKEPTPMKVSPYPTFNNTIRPSPEFMSISRADPVPSSFTFSRSHIKEEVPSKVPSDPFHVASKMKTLELKMKESEKMSQQHMIHPSMRRKLAESVKGMRSKYNYLKEQRLNTIKQDRVFNNWYPSSRDKPLTANHTRRDLLDKYRKTTPDIFNGYATQHRREGIKVVAQPHDSYKALFVPVERKINTERTQRLQVQWGSGNDIISGNRFEI